MKKKIEVVAALIKKNDKYLCAKRQNKGELANKWEFPGGKVEDGETHEVALIREIKEELDIIVEPIDFIKTIQHEYQTFEIILHNYLCILIDGDINLFEHSDYKWLTLEEMNKYDFAEADLILIKHLILNYKII